MMIWTQVDLKVRDARIGPQIIAMEETRSVMVRDSRIHRLNIPAESVGPRVTPAPPKNSPVSTPNQNSRLINF